MKKLLIKMVSVLLVSCMLVPLFVACGDTPPEQTETSHECVFDTKLSFDENYHFYKCTNETCDKKNQNTKHVWDEGTITIYPTKTQKGTKKFHCECGATKNQDIQLTAPTANQVYMARQAVIAENYEGYDFKFELKGDISALGFEKSANGVYEGQYRLNKTSGQETYHRKSSGILFYDSEVYSYTANSQKIKLFLIKTVFCSSG